MNLICIICVMITLCLLQHPDSKRENGSKSVHIEDWEDWTWIEFHLSSESQQKLQWVRSVSGCAVELNILQRPIFPLLTL